MNVPLTNEDRLRIRLFHMIYKELWDETDANMRFIKAIVLTSDEWLDLDGKDELIDEWVRKYTRRPKGGRLER